MSKYLDIKYQSRAKIHNIMIPATCASQPYENQPMKPSKSQLEKLIFNIIFMRLTNVLMS